MSDRTRLLWGYISERCAAGLPPTHEEMRQAIGLRPSSGGLAWQVAKLERLGYVRREKADQARNIRVLIPLLPAKLPERECKPSGLSLGIIARESKKEN